MNRRRQLPAMSKHRFRRAGVAAAAVIGLAAVSLVVLVFALPALTGEVRTWSSATGAYKTEAELVQLKDDGTVVLKKKDGAMIEVPLSKLSVRRPAVRPRADQAQARRHAGHVAGQALLGTGQIAGGRRRRRQDRQRTAQRRPRKPRPRPGLPHRQRSRAHLQVLSRQAESHGTAAGHGRSQPRSVAEKGRRQPGPPRHAVDDQGRGRQDPREGGRQDRARHGAVATEQRRPGPSRRSKKPACSTPTASRPTFSWASSGAWCQQRPQGAVAF